MARAKHPRAQYSAADLATVRRVMGGHVGPENAAPIGVIAAECGIDLRKVRAALSDLDGSAFLEGEHAGGRFLARSPEEAAAMSGRLKARALDELARCDRRDAYIAAMSVGPVTQLSLFGAVAA